MYSILLLRGVIDVLSSLRAFAKKKRVPVRNEFHPHRSLQDFEPNSGVPL